MKRGGGGSAAKGVYKRGKLEAKAERCTGASETVGRRCGREGEKGAGRSCPAERH